MAAALALGIGSLASGLGGSFLSSRAQRNAGREAARRLASTASPEEIAQRSVNVRRFEAFPRILETRRDFDNQFLAADLAQLERADSARRRILEDDVIPSISRQRRALLGRDVNDFNQILNQQGAGFRQGLLALSPSLGIAEEGLQRDEGLLSTLRGQAEADLALGSDLSQEDIRAIEQQTASAVGRRGRGAGAFSVGQLALARQGARDAREAQRRNFAANIFGLGGEAQRRRLAQSQQFTSPFLNLLSQSQQANRNLVGSPGQQLGQSRAIALQATPDIPAIDPSILQLESLRLGQGATAANLGQQANLAAANTLAGGFAGASAFGGNLAGQLIAQQPVTIGSGFSNTGTGAGFNINQGFGQTTLQGPAGPTGQFFLNRP